MKALLLGGTGFVGRVVAKHLDRLEGCEVIIAARKTASTPAGKAISIDATDTRAMIEVFGDADVVVNCVTGSADIIQRSAAAIVQAAVESGAMPRVVHMSSMAVYGRQVGELTEDEPVSDDGNWYGKAKIAAEDIFQHYGDRGGTSIVLRIGCVYGPGSPLWVDRIGLLIRSGRLGDLAELGDGWSNLVHVDDVAKAVVLSTQAENQGVTTFNLSAPDSPRWNTYFRDLALAMEWVPFKYKTRLSMMLETRLIAPPIKIVERVAAKFGIAAPHLPSIPPSLLALWSQQIKLRSDRIGRELGLEWTPYRRGLSDSADYLNTQYG